jgi:RND family efflux transporter MFP subunit
MEKKFRMKNNPSFAMRTVRVLLILAIAAGLAKLLVSLKKPPEKKQVTTTPPSVRVVVAKPVSKIMTVEAFGTVKPRNSVKITAEVPGRIEYIHPDFVEGGQVGRNQVLIRIDSRSYELGVQAGMARLRQAKAEIDNQNQTIVNLEKDIKLSQEDVKLAAKELSRIKALHTSKFASKTSLDKAQQQYLRTKIQLQNIENQLALARTAMELKKASLDMAEVDLARARLSLDKTRISLPFDGFVMDKSAQQGEYVNPGQVIGVVYQKDMLDVDIRIPLEDIKWIGPSFLEGRMPDASVIMDNFAGAEPFVWKARVARLKAEIDEKTRTLPMTLEIITAGSDNKSVFDLKPGAFVQCKIQGKVFHDIFVLPRYLLKPDNILFTIRNNYLKFIRVGVLRKFEDKVYINSGLEPGDKIVCSPLPGALDGMAVTIREEINRQ